MIELPDLDDRTFADLVAEARALIPTLAPGWTDHNPTDPGIVLVELFAWLVEIVLYRVDRVPERSYRTFLRLLRGPDAPVATTTPLDEAIRTTLVDLRENHRAITADDFEQLALRDGAVRRARGFAEHSPQTLLVPDGRAEGHYTLAVVAATRRHALELDGQAGYVDCGNHASLAITGPLTLSAWIFARALDHRQTIVGKDGGGEYELVLETTGALTFRQAGGVVGGDGGDGGAAAPPTPRVRAGAWHHVAAVRDAGVARLYIDGKPAGTARLAGPAVATTSPVLLGRSPAGGNFFDGILRDVCIWNVVRSEAQLGLDRRGAAPGSDDGPREPRPVACWRLDDGDAVARDAETPAAEKIAGPRDGALRPPPTPGSPGPARWRDLTRSLPASPALLARLFDRLDEWRLLTTKVHVIDHRPVEIDLTAQLYLRSDGVPRTVRDLATAAIDRFLDPLGGWDGAGWPFGRTIFEPDLRALLDDLAGVDFVGPVTLALADPSGPARPPSPPGGLALHPHELPVLRSLTCQLYYRVGTKWQPI